MKYYWRCPACGGAIPDDSEFCPLCGVKLKIKKSSAEPATDKEPAPAPAKESAKSRFTAADARRAIVAAEILSPPVSKRRR
ncbi:MAG: hypothetical protein K6F67_08235 [Oscillospiraceae bacterium]|nr:hypothetical protein [Oscillospiraceae bacterium]